MKMALFQLNTAYNQLERNMKKIEDVMSRREASLYVAPELFNTGYELDAVFSRAGNSEKVLQWASDLARESKCAFIPGSLAVRQDDKVKNTMFVLGPDGKQRAEYSKIHLFTLTGEEKIFHRGEKPVLVDIEGMRFGLAVCYDLRFPELFRFYRSRGAHGVIIVANWPQSRAEHWRLLGQARSIENAFYVLGVNRTGRDGGLTFNGGSFCFSPRGEELLRDSDTDVATAVLDVGLVDEARAFMDSFRDRRLNFEEGL